MPKSSRLNALAFVPFGIVVALAISYWLALSSVVLALLVFAGLYIMSLLYVALPQGDSTDMTGALIAVSMLVSSPLTTMILVVASAILAHISTRESGSGRELARILLCKALLVGIAAPFVHLVDPHSALPVLAFCSVVLVLDALLLQAETAFRLRQPLWPLLAGAVRLQGWILASEISIATLGTLMSVNMGYWSVALVVLLLAVMRQSFTLLLDVRQAYRAVVEALVRSVEIQNPERRGHSERVSSIAVAAARHVGIHGADLEALSYASLLHDIGAAESDDEEAREETSKASAVVSSVQFLSNAVPILRAFEAPSPHMDCRHLRSAYVVHLAHVMDMTGARQPPSSDWVQVIDRFDAAALEEAVRLAFAANRNDVNDGVF